MMTFMRDGTLPDDRALLSQLYREAVYWNLSSMQRAIEEERVCSVVCNLYMNFVLFFTCTCAFVVTSEISFE